VNRYLLFAGDNYYPCGGMDDFVGHYSTMAELVANIGQEDWFNILDTKTGRIILDREVDGDMREWAHAFDRNNGNL
jgi:hypothetical protein